jgi:uncharacterized repeat protein (TIGR01451 family)
MQPVAGSQPARRRHVPRPVAPSRPRRGMVRWSAPFRVLGAFLAIVSVLTAAGALGASPAGATVPGQPGTTQAGTPVFTEDFENPAGLDPTNVNPVAYNVSSPSYVGAGGKTYTGSPEWIDGERCDGVIISYQNTGTPSWALTDNGASVTPPAPPYRCSTSTGVESLQFLRLLARAMGQQFGGGDANQVVSQFTECNNTNSSSYSGSTVCPTIPTGSTNGVMLQTEQSFTTIPGHYYVFGVDTAYICGSSASDPRYQFGYFTGNNPATVAPVGAELNGCSTTNSPTVQHFTRSYTLDSTYGAFSGQTRTISLNSMLTNSAVRATTTSMGISLWNNQGATNGNDGSFDNIRVVDVTPQLDKSVSPSSITQGSTSKLTFTITNTSELDAKPNWTFVDQLPTGVVVANPNGVTTTCLNPAGTAGTQATVTAAAGSTSVTVNGSLAAGQSSCTVTVDVTAAGPGTYTNSGCTDTTGAPIPGCVSNFTTLNGLNPPGPAVVTVTPVIDLSIKKTVTESSYVAGGTIHYQVTVSNAASTASNPISTAIGVVVSDPIPSSITGASWTCTASTGGSCTSGSGSSITDTVTIPAGGSVTYDVTGTVAAGATGNLVNTATAVPPATMLVPGAPGGSGPYPVTDANCPPSPGAGCSASVTTPPRAIDLVKTPSPTTFTAAGQTITYTFKATNTGGVTLHGVTITDPLPGLSALTCNPVAPATLAPGTSMTCTATYVTKQSDVDAGRVDNTATTQGLDPAGLPVSDMASATVTATAAASIDLVKTANPTTFTAAGQPITYTFVATNTGSVTLSDVTIDDPLPGLSPLTCDPAQPAVLAPGATLTCTATYVTTEADVDAGKVTNSATTHGETPNHHRLHHESSVTVTVQPPVVLDTSTDNPHLGSLPRTGLDLLAMAGLGFGLLGFGVLLAAGSRRRRVTS